MGEKREKGKENDVEGRGEKNPNFTKQERVNYAEMCSYKTFPSPLTAIFSPYFCCMFSQAPVEEPGLS